MPKDPDKENSKEGKGKTPEHEVRIYSLATTSNECIIFLEEVNGTRLLPIWIGLSEGQAIAIRFSGIVLPRPLTHDLLLSAIKVLGWNVEKVVVNDLKDNTFYAHIQLRKNSQVQLIDSRPSDAIAVAVRAGCQIYVDEKVFERCQVLNKPISEGEVEKFKSELKNLRPEDIFKDIKEKQGKDKDESGKGEKKSGDKDDDE